MKPIYITCLVNMVTILVLCGFFATDGTGTVADYLTHASLISVFWSVLCILIGVLFLVFRRNRWGESFLFLAGILLLLSFIEWSLSGVIVP